MRMSKKNSKQPNEKLSFSIERLRLELSKQVIAESLKISLPTLNSRIENPQRWTVNNLKQLKKLGFTNDYFRQLLREFA